MSDASTGQVNRSAAEVYDEFFIPALMGEWPPRVADAAGVGPGQRVLDVACGTGVLALEAAGRVGPAGEVVGLDPNDGMLAVAARKAPQVTWRKGLAEAIPFEDGTFDAVVSQFGLMFFEDRRGAIAEMARVLRPGGRLAVAVWDSLENTPGYAAMVSLLDRLFGAEAADGLRSPYVLGDTEELAALFDRAPLDGVEVTTHTGTARFPSIDAWAYTDIKGWVMADMLSDAEYDRLLAEARRELARFVIEDGTVAFPAPAHIVSARRPGE